MPYIVPAAIIGGSSLLGGYMQGKAAQNAANTSAQAQLEAARIAADAAKFRPVGITTRYGSSQFQTNPQGYVTGASYMGTPELQAMQDRVDAINRANLGYAEQTPSLYNPLLGGAQGLFNIAGQGLKASPEQMASDWMQKQQALLAPSRERESALLANQLSNSGRTGLSVAQGGGLLSANPEQSALANARAMQDLQLAANATQAGQQATNFYSGLFGTAGNLTSQYGQGLTGGFSPFNAGIATGTTLEGLAQNPLDVGINLGAKGMSPSAANSLLYGGINAAKTAQSANAFSPLGNAIQGVGTNPYFANALGSWFGGTNSMGNTIYNPATMNPYTQYGRGVGSLVGGTSGIGD